MAFRFSFRPALGRNPSRFSLPAVRYSLFSCRPLVFLFLLPIFLTPVNALAWYRVGTGSDDSLPCNAYYSSSLAFKPSTDTIEFCDGTTWNSLLGANGGIVLGTSVIATNPQRSGDPTTGLFSAATSTVSIAAGGVGIVTIGTNGVNIANGTLTGTSATNNFLNVTGTLPSTNTATARGVVFNVTSAGSSSFVQQAFNIFLNSGYTGSSGTAAAEFQNSVAGTGAGSWTSSAANYGSIAGSTATTTGWNIGTWGKASGSSAVDAGVEGNATISDSAVTHLGVIGLANNATNNVAGMFALVNGTSSTLPTITQSAALIADNGTTSSPIFVAQNNGTALVTISSTGLVGIGTGVPNAALTVGPAVTFPQGAITVQNPIGGGNGTAVSILELANIGCNCTGSGVTMNFTTSGGASGTTPTAFISASQDASGNANMIFGAGAYAEKMRISSAGNVGIGTSSPAEPLELYSPGAGVLLQLTGSSGTCNHTPGSSSETVSCSSDMRLKSDTLDAPSALPWLSSIRVRNYTWKKTGEKRTGVIAQELQKTHPEMVTYDKKKDEWTVEQPNPWTLVKILQEQQAEIDDLKKQLAAKRDESSVPKR